MHVYGMSATRKQNYTVVFKLQVVERAERTTNMKQAENSESTRREYKNGSCKDSV